MKTLTEKDELAEAIKGGGTTHQPNTSNGFANSPGLSPVSTNQLLENLAPVLNIPSGDATQYQQHMQRAFLQSAMVQNLQIQQQLLAQNQALQTLLSQQETSPKQGQSSSQSHITSRKQSSDKSRKASSDSNNSHIPPPPPPPMPPPPEFHDPLEQRPFLDPYGRAKTVRIGKWRWPPPKDGISGEVDENFMQFKLRQNQRKTTPQSQISMDSSPNGSSAQVDWDEFEVENVVVKATSTPQAKYNQNETIIQTTAQVTKASRRSFDIGADRPAPGSVGKLKLSSEMRQRLEQVTAGHSVRSSTSNTSEQRTPAKLEDARKMMLQQQLSGSGHFMANADKLDGNEKPSVRTQIQRMEASKRPPPPPWPMMPPAPNVPAPPPPVRPPTTAAPKPANSTQQQNQQELPAFYQRQERDTFGIHQVQQNWNGSEISKDTYDSWGRAEAAKLDMVYEMNYKKEIKMDRGRSRSRSRSRDREHFSESVWDRNEVEGPPSTGSDRERVKEQEKRERMMEMKQVERERESQKVYQPAAPKSSMYEREKDKPVKKTSQTHERATFKTHMNQRMERERKSSASTMVTQNSENNDDLNWQSGSIAVPVPVPPSLKSPAAACLTYNRVPWKLRVRKEIFRPNEPIGPPAALDLLFAQICYDVFGTLPCLRIAPQERRNALNLLSGHGVTAENIKSSVRAIVKRHLVDMARSWPLYFARLFIVNASPQLPEVSILAVSHSGVYLARRDNDYISVIHSVPYAELSGATTLPRPASLQLNLKNGSRVILHAHRAFAIQQMIQAFCQEYKQVSSCYMYFYCTYTVDGNYYSKLTSGNFNSYSL